MCTIKIGVNRLCQNLLYCLVNTLVFGFRCDVVTHCFSLVKVVSASHDSSPKIPASWLFTSNSQILQFTQVPKLGHNHRVFSPWWRCCPDEAALFPPPFREGKRRGLLWRTLAAISLGVPAAVGVRYAVSEPKERRKMRIVVEGFGRFCRYVWCFTHICTPPVAL